MIDEITSDYLNKLCPDKNPEQKLGHLFDRLKSNIIYYINDLALELDNSDFKPAFFEFKFSDPKNGCPPRKFKRNDGVVVSMSGIADRVDLYAPEDEDNLYLRVVDYKTGEKTFKLDEFKNGREIQLPLYLSTLCQPNTEFAKKLLKKFGKKELKPASVVYFPMKIGKSSVMSPTDGIDSDSAKSSETAELIKNSKRNGFFLDSEKVLFAQDKNRGVKGKRTFLPSKTVKNAHLFLPEDAFQNAVETQLNETITKITDRLLSGEACASPLNGDTENICKYCSRLFVCRKRRKV
jgi:ATP-dependent helicase/nuclease subunit B